jgi:formylmethanofuran dehydrogenase subunit E
MYSDNPIADFLSYDAEQESKREKMPVCSVCGEHIQDDFLYDIDGEIFCEECLNENFRKCTDDYIND